MPNPIQILRSAVTGNRPPAGKLPGEPYVNWADRQFGVVDAAGATQDLIGVRHWSAEAAYVPGDHVIQDGRMYSARDAIAPGPFVEAQWFRLTRKRLYAPMRLYVDGATGNDLTGDGSQAAPWATVYQAGAWISDELDFNGHNVILHVAAGDYDFATFTALVGGGGVTIVGAGKDVTNIRKLNLLYSPASLFVVYNMTLKPLAGDSAFLVNNTKLQIEGASGGIAIDSTLTTSVATLQDGASLRTYGPIEVRTNGTVGSYCFNLERACEWFDSAQWTLTGATPNTYSSFVRMDNARYTGAGAADYSGPSLGKRFELVSGSLADTTATIVRDGEFDVIVTHGDGSTRRLDLFPGDQPGTWDSSSWYDGVQGGAATPDAIPHFLDTEAYAPGANVLYRSQIYACSVATGPGPFRYPDWKTITRREAEWGSLSVETTGDDALGDGSAAAPWATLQRAFDHISNDLDIGIAGLTINIGVGVFVGPKIWNPYGGSPSGGYIRIVGAGVDQTIIIENNALACFYVEDATVDLSVTAVTLRVGVASAVFADRSMISLVGPMAIETSQVGGGGVIAMVTETALFAAGAIELRQTGAATPNTGAFDIKSHSHFVDGAQWTLSGTPNTYSAWVELDEHSYYSGSATFTGACVGKRYQGTHGAIFNSGGRGVDLLPGDAPGTLDASSFYDGVQGGTTGRILLTAPLALTVDAAGSDTAGDGSAAAPWATLAKAADHIRTRLDLNFQTVTVSIGAGTFAGADFYAKDGTVKLVGAGKDITFVNTSMKAYGFFTFMASNMTVMIVGTNAFRAEDGCTLILDGGIALDASVVTYDPICIRYFSAGVIRGDIELRQTGIAFSGGFISVGPYSTLSDQAQWTLTGTPNTYADWLTLYDHSKAMLLGSTYTGTGVLGPSYSLTTMSYLETKGIILPGDLPTSVCDNSSFVDGVQGNHLEVLTANREYFIDAAGSDANTGSQLAVTRDEVTGLIYGPWATLRKAFDTIAKDIDFNGFTITLNLGAGVFAGSWCDTLTGGGALYIKGAGSTLTTIGDAATGTCVQVYGNNTEKRTAIYLNRVTLIPGNSYYGIYIIDGGLVRIGDAFWVDPIDLVFSTINTPQYLVFLTGALSQFVTGDGAISVLMNGVAFYSMFLIQGGALLDVDQAVWTYTGTPDTMTDAFIKLDDSEYVWRSPCAHVGSVIGKRFDLKHWSMVRKTGGTIPVDLFPGTLPGTWDGSSFYDGVPGGQRRVLTANESFYVDAAGSDTNSGSSAATAFLTLQKAFDTVAKTLDLNGLTVTINIGAGSFFGGVLAGMVGGGRTGKIFVYGAGSALTTITPPGVGSPYYATIGFGLAGDGGLVKCYLNGVSIVTNGNDSCVTGVNAYSIYLMDSASWLTDIVLIPASNQGWALIDMVNSTLSTGAGSFEVRASTTGVIPSVIRVTKGSVLSDNADWVLTGIVNVAALVKGEDKGTLRRDAGTVTGDISGVQAQYSMSTYSHLTVNNSAFYPGPPGITDASGMYQGVMGNSISAVQGGTF